MFDHYMETLADHPQLELLGVADVDRARAATVAAYHGVKIYESNEALLADPAVELVVNLTSPQSHYAVSRACLEAGKHVYSEKPLSDSWVEAVGLVALAEQKGLMLSSAPCSVLSETCQTMWKAVRDGAVGRVCLVYAELDDNPIYKMQPNGWTNESGAPWPYLNEYAVGCTLEHAGYHLTWLAAMFGPAETLTAFSSCQVPDKTPLPLNPPDTPDFSVACIAFRSGVVARLTCSIVAPYNHRLQIIGNEGMIWVDECWQYSAPVYLERYSEVSLNARKLRTVRASSALQSAFGVGGRRQPFVKPPKSQLRNRWRDLVSRKRSPLDTAVKYASKRELVAMDFFRGVADMADAISASRDCLLNARFVLHVAEMALAIQNAGKSAQPYRLTTTFEPLVPPSSTLDSKQIYGRWRATSVVGALLERLIKRAHRH